MSDCDAVVADADLANDEAQDALALLDGEVLGVLGEACEELFEVLGELEVGLGVVQFGVEGVELGGERGLAFSQRGHPGAQLVERDELFLVGLDQPVVAGPDACEFALEPVAAVGGWVLGAQRLEAAVDLGAD